MNHGGTTGDEDTTVDTWGQDSYSGGYSYGFDGGNGWNTSSFTDSGAEGGSSTETQVGVSFSASPSDLLSDSASTVALKA